MERGGRGGGVDHALPHTQTDLYTQHEITRHAPHPTHTHRPIKHLSSTTRAPTHTPGKHLSHTTSTALSSKPNTTARHPKAARDQSHADSLTFSLTKRRHPCPPPKKQNRPNPRLDWREQARGQNLNLRQLRVGGSSGRGGGGGGGGGGNISRGKRR